MFEMSLPDRIASLSSEDKWVYMNKQMAKTINRVPTIFNVSLAYKTNPRIPIKNEMLLITVALF